MKNLGYIASEITKGKNLEENLEKYGKGLTSLYNGLAYIKLSMNYYTILNMIKDNEIDDEHFLEIFQGVNEVIELAIYPKFFIYLFLYSYLSPWTICICFSYHTIHDTIILFYLRLSLSSASQKSNVAK